MPVGEERTPYVGSGEDGARRSARIDREEAELLDVFDERREALLRSAERWEAQADGRGRVRYMPRHPDTPAGSSAPTAKERNAQGDPQRTDPSNPPLVADPLMERTRLAMAATHHYLECATYYVQAAERGLQRRQQELDPTSTDACTPGTHDLIVELVACHLDTLQDAAASLASASVHLRDAYRDAAAMTYPPHLTEQNHAQVVDMLNDAVEVTVSVDAARPMLDAAVDQLRLDPASIDCIAAAREHIGRALPLLTQAQAQTTWSADAIEGAMAAQPDTDRPRPPPPAVDPHHARTMSR